MSKFAEQTCVDKRQRYRLLILIYMATQNTLKAAELNKDFDLAKYARLSLEAWKEDIEQMYQYQDSRCTLPTMQFVIQWEKKKNYGS